jgi:hypothetical protein
MYSRCSIQRIHGQPGIVCQNQFSGKKPAVMFGFDPRILLESLAIFNRQGHVLKIREGFNLDSYIGCGPAKIAQLSGVRCGDKDPGSGWHVYHDKQAGAQERGW